MNAIILETLKEHRQIVVDRYNEMIKENDLVGDFRIIRSDKFFFKVVFDHFDTLSKVIENRVLRSENDFFTQLYKAIDKATYACAKPCRDDNRQYFTNLK